MSRPTSRGILWEVLAPVVRWPLYSPARLLTVLAVVAAVVLVLPRVAGPGEGPPAASPAASATASPGSSPGDQRDSPDGPSPSTTTPAPGGSSSPPGPDLPAAATTAATTFLTSWARPAVPQRSWYAALAPLATPDLAQGLAVTDPRNVPATRVTGPLEPEEVSPNLTAPTSVVFVAATDAGAVAVTVTLTGSAWLVAHVAPAERDDPVV